MSDQVDAPSMQGPRSTLSRYWVQRRERVQARTRPFSPGSSTGAIGHDRPVSVVSKFSIERTFALRKRSAVADV
jgi:hypothetical protein